MHMILSIKYFSNHQQWNDFWDYFRFISVKGIFLGNVFDSILVWRSTNVSWQTKGKLFASG